MTDPAPVGWTLPTLEIHFQRQLDDLRAMLDERYQTQTKAVDAAFASAKAESAALATSLTDKLGSMNEFRGQLSDQASEFMSRAEADARFSAVQEKVDATVRRLDLTQGHSTGIQATWATLFAVAGLVAAVTAIVVNATK